MLFSHASSSFVPPKLLPFFLSTFFHDYALIGFVFPYVSALRVGFWFRRLVPSNIGEGSKRIVGKVGAPVLSVHVLCFIHK